MAVTVIPCVDAPVDGRPPSVDAAAVAAGAAPDAEGFEPAGEIVVVDAAVSRVLKFG